jgi:phosphoenolpyruvate phosphomutase
MRSEATMTQARRLRAALHGPRLARAVGAHSPLSALLAQEAGFDVVWSSGLEISASQATPDANILSMTECLDVAASMVAAVAVPVLADCDSGFGNVSNVMHMVRSYERQDVAGVCIEDKPFPKLNSFIGDDQDLADVDEFAAKISAAQSAKVDPDFVVVARTEALICGAGLPEAVRRAHAYEQAGADAILIHSKHGDATEIMQFRAAYDGLLPVVVVPTTYPEVRVDELQRAGFAMAIYANHSLRSSIAAMRSTLARIAADGTTEHVEPSLATLDDVFELQGVPEMLEDRIRFEPIAPAPKAP